MPDSKLEPLALVQKYQELVLVYEALDKEIDQKGRADQFQVNTALLYTTAFNSAQAIKNKGLLP